MLAVHPQTPPLPHRPPANVSHYQQCRLLKATKFIGNTSLFVCFLFVGVLLFMNTERQQSSLGHTGASLAYLREKLTIITTVSAPLPKPTLTKQTLIDFKEMHELWPLSISGLQKEFR